MNNSASSAPPTDPPKKESRLKHFFSPIRKKSVVPPVPPVLSQPDVFVSNILPNNLYVNPALRAQSSLPDSSVKVESTAVETASPTSSFQVTLMISLV